jgi:hypothetical protein
VSSTACDRARLDVSPEVLKVAPPDLLDHIRGDAYSYFRLTNREWTSRVCEIFASDLPNQPVVQLHGDAHVEQFAFMKGAWGLDDFDDASKGPAFIDIIRFLGSIDLAARERGWTHDRERLFDRFFAGYRKGLSDPAYDPPEPAVVKRKKAAAATLSHGEFLAWAEAQMAPLDDASMRNVIAAMRIFSGIVRAEEPALPDGYFRVIRAGWLHMGIGSADLRKVLMRVDGPSPDPSDDVLIEAKAIRSRDPLPCIEQPAVRPTFRIIEGAHQLGRLKHDILAAGPELALPEMTIQGQNLRDWWVRSWDPSYHEIDLSDPQSADELGDIAYDSGDQLAAGTLHGIDPPSVAALGGRLMKAIDQNEARYRRAAERLVEELLRGWHDVDRQIARSR